MPALPQVSHAAPDVQFLQQVGIDVRDEGGFGIGGGFRDDGLIGEGEVGGGEHGALGILDVHVDDAGEIAHAAGDGDITLVFDRPGLAAITDAVVAGGSVRAEGDKENPHATVSEEAAQFREFDVVADQHGDLPAVGVQHLEFVTADHAPIPRLAGRDVQLELMVPGAIAPAEVDDVVELPVAVKRHRTGDDIDVILDGFLDEKIADFFGESGQFPDGGGGSVGVERSHQRSVDVFREDHEVGLIAAHGINEKFHIIEELAQARRAAHLHLHQPQPDHTLGAERRAWRRVVHVVPLDQRGVGMGFGVIQQVVCQGFFDMEIIAELERHHGIVDFLAPYLVDVFARRQLVLVFAVARHPSARHDGPEVQPLAEFLSGIVKAASQPQALGVRIHADLNAIEHIPVGIVGGELETARDIAVAVFIAIKRVVHHEGKGEGDQLAMVLHAHLAFRKGAQEAHELGFGPARIDHRIQSPRDVCHGGRIRRRERADHNLVTGRRGGGAHGKEGCGTGTPKDGGRAVPSSRTENPPKSRNPPAKIFWAIHNTMAALSQVQASPWLPPGIS